jgi:phage baseplate assembly protein W
MDWSTVVNAIKFPFTTQTNGIVQTTDNSSKIYLDKVVTLLSTNVGQRPMLPTYGVDWSLALFENDGDAELAVPRAINTAISTWIPSVSVENISVEPDYLNGTENITIDLKLPNNILTSLTLNSSVINYDGTIK